MKQVKIKFVDFISSKEIESILEILSKRYNVIQTENPDYLFYSVYGNKYLNYTNCIRIFYTSECLTPNFNECDYAIGFDRLEFGDRYLRIPLYQLFHYRNELVKIRNRKHFDIEDLKEKTDFCNYVVSNSYVKDVRTEIFNMLNEYKRVNSGGRYMNNIGGPVKDKFAFQKKHKFSIAFENCSYDGYSTEKIADAFAAETIPIYWGDPRIGLDFNEDAFINCHRYNSLEEVVAKVKQIDQDDELFMNMINSPILKCEDLHMDNFLYHIFDQPYEKARRRPYSQHSINREKYVKRYAFIQKHIVNKVQYIRNKIYEYRNHTILTQKYFR